MRSQPIHNLCNWNVGTSCTRGPRSYLATLVTFVNATISVAVISHKLARCSDNIIFCPLCNFDSRQQTVLTFAAATRAHQIMAASKPQTPAGHVRPTRGRSDPPRRHRRLSCVSSVIISTLLPETARSVLLTTYSPSHGDVEQ